jgi:hypothetical protein
VQAVVPTGQAPHQILQNVGPAETLGVCVARAIYDAAGRPQIRYSCLVLPTVCYRVLDEWCSVQLETSRVEMAALSVLDLHSARRYDNKKMKRIKGPLDLTTKEHKG